MADPLGWKGRSLLFVVFGRKDADFAVAFEDGGVDIGEGS